ncbi:MAG: CSLREA domain-containing protein [Chloroflexota bacterium]
MVTRTLVALTVALLLSFAGLVGIADAATFAVNTTTDAVDDTPGDGNCRTASNQCSLRAAVMEANALGGSHTITLGTNTYPITIAGTGEDAAATGDLDVTANITVQGVSSATTVIDGGAVDGVFDVKTGGTLSLIDLQVVNAVGFGGPPLAVTRNAGELITTRARIDATGEAIIENSGVWTATHTVLHASGFSPSGPGKIINNGTVSLLDSSLDPTNLYAPVVLIANQPSGVMTILRSSTLQTVNTLLLNNYGHVLIEQSTLDVRENPSGFIWQAQGSMQIRRSTLLHGDATRGIAISGGAGIDRREHIEGGQPDTLGGLDQHSWLDTREAERRYATAFNVLGPGDLAGAQHRRMGYLWFLRARRPQRRLRGSPAVGRQRRSNQDHGAGPDQRRYRSRRSRHLRHC